MDTDKARTALMDMVGHYHVCPVPAFDIKGNLMPPDQYVSLLAGATVAVQFLLQRYVLSDRQTRRVRDVFVTDITSLRVVVEPCVPQLSGSHKRLMKKDPFVIDLTDSNNKRKKK